MFPKPLLDLFKINQRSLSNHLAALVCPKAFQTELDELAPSFGVVPYTEKIARMKVINDLAVQSRDLLYQYNKEKLNNFMD